MDSENLLELVICEILEVVVAKESRVVDQYVDATEVSESKVGDGLAAFWSRHGIVGGNCPTAKIGDFGYDCVCVVAEDIVHYDRAPACGDV